VSETLETTQPGSGEASDAELVLRAQGQDFAAFEALVNRYEGRIYALARRILSQHQDAQDVVQATFLSMLEHLDGFRGDASFKTWLLRIATNKALNHLEKRRRHAGVPLDGGADDGDPIPRPQFIADWRSDFEHTVARRELERVLDEAIAELPEKHRAVFVLRDVEGLSVRETAGALGLSEANVKVRLLRARLMLRETLTRRFGDPATRVTPGHHHPAVEAAGGAS
jgi:RNA polymerase sigma-70 factor, ECF subfamily